MRHFYTFFGFVCIIVLTTACSSESHFSTVQLHDESGEKIVDVSVEIAKSDQERAKGLMHRKHVPKKHGMLFVFDDEHILSFWMKNTLIPLDILYFDHEFSLVSWKTMEPCTKEPCRQYSSVFPAKYALEVPKGFTKKYSVRKGWRLTLLTDQDI